ncbi:hypothetical protein MNBD_GAMMA01-344 [hydrothermal vent metagenome]|uniref:Ribbon-helix-helix protein CopG domain-containing protein n=1 Tax=hydrothermal vent metagenome TaxID=652676 RepID=A0A3B0W8E7_9ZZZZ
MTAKTERVTILTTPDFKNYLGEQAKNLGVSVSELIRMRCIEDTVPSSDEVLLKELITQSKKAISKANSSLDKGLNDIAETLAYLKNQRA